MKDLEKEVQELTKAYRYETDAELDRKRMVFLSHVVNQTRDEIAEGAKDVAANKRLHEALSVIIRRRERAKRRREFLKELLLWVGLITPFLAGWGASGTLNKIVSVTWNAVSIISDSQDQNRTKNQSNP